MTTVVQFAGAKTSFQAALDGATYQLSVRWNVFGQRWYLSCWGGNDTMIFNLPLISSPAEGGINLIQPYFEVSTLVFREHTQQFEINP